MKITLMSIAIGVIYRHFEILNVDTIRRNRSLLGVYWLCGKYSIDVLFMHVKR